MVRRLSPALTLILAQRLWQGGAGLVTVLIISNVLTLEAQGWYYSFLSVAALYTLFDLGLSLVLVQVAAHGSVAVRWTADGYFEGDNSGHLAALIAFAARHYVVLAFGYLVLVLPSGWLFFSSSPAPYPSWQQAWLILALAMAAALMIVPFLAIVEGSGGIVGVSAVRLVQSVLGSIAVWTVLIAGGGLWATAMPALMAAICGVFWLLLRRPGAVSSLRADPNLMDWKNDIWPLQWRLGVSWFSGYLLSQIHTPILFAIDGAVAAGQIGLSISVGNMIGHVAQSFVARHVPAMAKAAAQRDWVEMDRLFHRDFMMSCAVFVVGGLAACGLMLLLSNTPYGSRAIPPLPFAGLVVALLLGHVHALLAAQLRSYRREPLLWISASAALATLVLAPPAAWLAGAEGIVAVMLAVQILLVMPLSIVLFVRCNAEWRVL